MAEMRARVPERRGRALMGRLCTWSVRTPYMLLGLRLLPSGWSITRLAEMARSAKKRLERRPESSETWGWVTGESLSTLGRPEAGSWGHGYQAVQLPRLCSELRRSGLGPRS